MSHIKGIECPDCGQETLVAETVDAEGLPLGEMSCTSCGKVFLEAVDVREAHRCEAENCESMETAEYHNQWITPEDNLPATEWLCDEHAIESGFCLGCHYFCAGMENYDFSPIKGYCGECVEELRYESGEYDDDDDDDNMFALWDYDTWEDIIENETGGRWIGPGSESAAPEDE